MYNKENHVIQPAAATSQLSVVMVPQEVWENVVSGINELKQALSEKPSSTADEWIESNAARKQLGICQKTWQTYRDRRLIPFSQFGHKIYMKRSDLNAFMENHYITAK